MSQTTALGAAILAGAVSGFYPGTAEASGAMGKRGGTLDMTLGHYARYQPLLERFRVLHFTLRTRHA